MRWKPSWRIGAGAALGLVTMALVAPAGLDAADGQVLYVLGTVTVHRGGQTLEVDPGMAVGLGDVLETGSDGAAVLELAGGVELKLRENTQLSLDSLGQSVAVGLDRGSLFSRVALRATGRYSVRTESAVAAVRGTEFFVAYGRRIDELADVWLCVNEGSVEVSLPSSAQSLLVHQGEGINIVGGTKLTAPRRYGWTRRLNWNTDPSAGEVVDRTDLDQAYSDLLDQDYQ